MDQILIGLISTITTQLTKGAKMLPKISAGKVANLRYFSAGLALLLAGLNAYLDGGLVAFIEGPTVQIALMGVLKTIVTVLAPHVWYVIAKKLNFSNS